MSSKMPVIQLASQTNKTDNIDQYETHMDQKE